MDDVVSEVFDYSDEGFAKYKRWQSDFNDLMILKHGDNALESLASLSEVYIDGIRKILVVLEVRLKEKKDD